MPQRKCIGNEAGATTVPGTAVSATGAAVSATGAEAVADVSVVALGDDPPVVTVTEAP
ncbi:MAG: hypothetical protein ACKVPX_07520 [Myxococcaceae bacterium]